MIQTIEVADKIVGGKTTKKKFGHVLVGDSIILTRVFLDSDEYNKEVVGSRDYLYLVTVDGSSHQLDQLTTVRKGVQRQVSNQFRGILKYLFRDCPVAQKESDRVRFVNSDIIKVIRYYSECTGTEIQKFVQSEPTFKITHAVGAGYLPFKDDGFTEHGAYSFGYLGDIRFPTLSKGLRVQLQLEGITRSVGRIERDKQNQFLVNTKVLLNGYPIEKPTFSWQIGAGLGFYSVIRKNSTSIPENSFVLFELSTKVRIGRLMLSWSRGGQPAKILADSPEAITSINVHYLLSPVK